MGRMSAAELTHDATTHAVLTVLGGTPLAHAAATAGMSSAELAEAVETYHQAGHAALTTRTDRGWYQIALELPPDHLEETLTSSLAPQLRQLTTTGAITGWWFLRKTPGLRLRITPADNASTIDPLLNELQTTGALTTWRRGLYEPEQAAFGGPTAMSLAHELFAADSHHLTTYLHDPHPPLGRRELSLLLCSSLFRAAGQEWFECGDIWHRVSRTRPAPPPLAHPEQLTHQLHTLLTHDPHPRGPLFSPEGPLHTYAPWAHAFAHTGHALAHPHPLQRGLRDILAHHVLFHWNRLGLNTTTQSILARTATTALLNTE
ncbi:hypothetical protein CDG81_17735 [Actinopolyspora erythraea]|uniref:Thiopeptide-type bacteriocin biosynthesis domain-containing protein n=2 Tax=Actinopolyspora erythraea TaxID=414996 RepID=A0A223RZE9_9ACTN|nr:hypothetical protein CDG81_17735 [Actinopolyspora erythraea]